LELVSESRGGGKRNSPGTSIVKTLAKRWGVSRQMVEQKRDSLVTRIRRHILAKVGSEEYLTLSASGKLPKDTKSKAQHDTHRKERDFSRRQEQADRPQIIQDGQPPL
jgi:hypothetical protein